MSSGGAQQHNLFLGASYPGFTLDFYDAGDSTTGKNVWHDEGKTTATQQITADTLGMAWWYADGDYLVDIKNSDGILLWSRDLWKMSSDTGTLWEGNQGTQYPPASSTNGGQMFALIDGSSNIIEIGYNDGSGFRRISGPEDVVSISSDYTVPLNVGVVLVDASGGSNITVTLHTAATRAGKTVIVKKTDSTSNTVIIEGDGSETIDASANQTLTDQFQAAFMKADSTNWILASTFTNFTHDHTSDAEGGIVADMVAQRVSLLTGVLNTGTTQMPIDDSIPQNDEGDEYMTLPVTPIDASNKLVIEGILYLANSTIASVMGVALFQDSTVDALVGAVGAKNDVADSVSVVPFKYEMVAGTASSTTFKVRAGTNAAGTTTFNGANAAGLFGGVMGSHIIITEYRVTS